MIDFGPAARRARTAASMLAPGGDAVVDEDHDLACAVGDRASAPVRLLAPAVARPSRWSITSRTCSSVMCKLDTTLSFITTPPPLASAPIASSDHRGTPSLRTRNTSSGACSAAATSQADRNTAAGQPEDQHTVPAAVGRQLLGQHATGLTAIAEGARSTFAGESRSVGS